MLVKTTALAATVPMGALRKFGTQRSTASTSGSARMASRCGDSNRATVPPRVAELA